VAAGRVSASARSARTSRVISVPVRAILHYAVLVVLAAIMVIPLAWMISTSLKDVSEAFLFPPKWIPTPPKWQNYADAWQAQPFGLYFVNSGKIAVFVIVGRLFFCSLAGYGFARFDFPLKNVMFAMLMAVLLIPSVATIVPLFIMYKWIGWYNTHWPLIVSPVLAQTFGTFLMRQFMLSIPIELEEAAYIDGASPFGIYWRIMLPLCKPALAVLAIFTFTGTWNAFFEPLVFLESRRLFTITLGLSSFQDEHGTQWTLLMAASTMALLPILVFFMLTQRYFVGGIALSGIKG
jgi:multiple sugar transport system permease protein